MFCLIDYPVEKKKLRDYFFANWNRAKHHKTAGSELTYWYKLFNVNDVVSPIIRDLGLTGMNNKPRFSFQYKDTRLPPHIDIDRIVGINFNLMDEVSTIHIEGIGYPYEGALIDVGARQHSVEPISTDRLVLKFAIREPWAKVYEALDKRSLLQTRADDYQSILKQEDVCKVRL